MYMKKRAMAAICAALMMISVPSFAASADNIENDAYTLSEAAYEMLLDYGIPADKLPSMPSRGYAKDMSYDVYCTSMDYSSEVITLTVSYIAGNIDYFEVLGGTVIGSSTTSGITTKTIQGTFYNTGKIMTIRYTRNTSSYTIPTPTVVSVKHGNTYCNTSDIEITGANSLGDVNESGGVDISDVMALTNFLVEAGTDNINTDNADVNSDGNVDGDDLTLLYQYIARINDHVWG
ncbi:MAG: hypothetical protein IKG82_00680 [Oscillospiraceae bacterium]|nr:hypothetical protein [Oscillospiraceae bacterium]MBR3417188.1 hypothetical protein [Oscillospiraceae bacterium]MBR4200446.1 hypothetical protein [Oscillospiraceae bacterium]